MAELGEIFDGSAVMEIYGNRTPAPVDPIRAPMDGRAIFANMASRFDSSPLSPRAAMLDRGTPPAPIDGETFDGSKIDRGPLSALDELRTHRQWVAWRLLTRPGAAKPTKPPVNPHNGLGASHSDPRTWGTHEQAEACAKRKNFAGVGFVLSEEDDYTGVDLDKCRDAASGRLDQWAEDIVSLGETYWEISPSGTGLRAIVRGKIEKTVKCDTAHVEVYRSLRYLTITGDHIDGTPEDIRPAPTTLEWLMDRVAQFAPKPEVEHRPTANIEQPLKQETALVEHRPHNDTGERAWAEVALERNAAALAACGEGGRNHDLNAKAFRMGRMVARGWIEKSRVEAALTDACRANGLFKDDGPKGVRDSLASGLRGGMAKPCADLDDARADEQRLRALGDETAKMLIEANDNSPRETIVVDGVTIDAETGEIVDEPPHEAEAPRAENEAPRPPAGSKPIELETISAASLAWKQVPRQHWLVEDLIPAGNVTLLSGDGATGKSLLALQLAVAVATSGHWIGLRPEPGRALYVSAEDEIEELHRRLARIVPKLETLGQLTFVPLAGKDAVLSAPGRDGLLKPTPIYTALRHIVAKHRPALLVLDTLADLFGGDEIKKVHVRQFLNMLRGLAIEFDVTVLLLSHPSQAGLSSGSGMSGNMAWSNSVRSRLYFERRVNKFDGSEDDADIRVLTTKKANRAAAGSKIVVRWRDGGFVRENQASDSRNINHDADRVFMTLLAQYEREERFVSDRPSAAYAPAVFAKHPKAEGMNKSVFQKAMDRLFDARKIRVEEVGPASKRRRKIAIADAPEGEGGSSGFDYQGDSDDAP